jgi:putative integral membrane protein (TIGR02587 family)
MAQSSAKNHPAIHSNRHFLISLGRAFAGAILFSFPVIMTMEMWSLGFSIDRYRLALFMFLAVPLLVGLSYYIGFEDTSCFLDDVIDAFVAYAVGFVTSAVFLLLFNVMDFSMSADEIIGKISIQAVIAAIGAMLAQSELGTHSSEAKKSEKKRRNTSYFGELFLMAVGALFLAMNPAPTEEIILIGFKMTDTHVIILAFFTLVLMHAFVYKVEFRGQHDHGEDAKWKLFLRFTVVGYALALLISLYLVWTFGHTDGLSWENIAKITVVMAFPASLGAAASRLIL